MTATILDVLLGTNLEIYNLSQNPITGAIADSYPLQIISEEEPLIHTSGMQVHTVFSKVVAGNVQNNLLLPPCVLLRVSKGSK